eukprot:384400-Rhodomonas_salina.1
MKWRMGSHLPSALLLSLQYREHGPTLALQAAARSSLSYSILRALHCVLADVLCAVYWVEVLLRRGVGEREGRVLSTCACGAASVRSRLTNRRGSNPNSFVMTMMMPALLMCVQ